MDDISFLSGRIDDLRVTTPGGQPVELGPQLFSPTLDGGKVDVPLMTVPENVSRLRLSGIFVIPTPNYRFPIPGDVDIPQLPDK